MKTQLILALGSALLLTACSANKTPAPTSGRISLLQTKEISESSDAGVLSLTSVESCANWPQNNGNADNRPCYTSTELPPQLLWSVSAGESFSDDTYSLARPVVVDGVIYSVDKEQFLFAHNIQTKELLFKIKLTDHETCAVKATGIAVHENKIFVALGNGVVTATDKTGKSIWNVSLSDSLRSAPTVSGTLLFIVTTNNRLYALDTETGKIKWNYKTLESKDVLFGMAQPAVKNNTVVAAFTTGEVSAFDTQSGLLKWSHMLLSPRVYNSILDLSHISASPIIGDNTVYVFNASGKMAALRLTDGKMLFTKETGTVHTPIFNGNALFFIDTHNTLTAINSNNGATFWKTPLPQLEKETYFLNPVLTQSHILIVQNTGKMFAYNAQNGLFSFETSGPDTLTAPITVDGSILFYSNDAELVLYK